MNLRNKLLFFLALNRYVETIVSGVPPLSLPDAIANSLGYLKAFGGTEQRNLPEEYTQLEYIESTGTQYIDTGYKPNNNTSIDIKFLTDSQAHFVFGSRKATSGTDQQRFCLYVGYNDFNPQYGNSNYPAVGLFGVSTVYQVQMNKNGLVVDGITEQAFNSANFTGENNLILFGNNTNGTFVSAENRIYYSKIHEDGTLVRNLIPAKRNSDNVVGMYDTVSGTFFTNAGTGTFAAGGEAVPSPDTPVDIWCNNGVIKARHQSGLPLGYTLLDYIESSGTQYIDTGVKFTGTTSVIEAGVVFVSGDSGWKTLSATQSDSNTRWGGIQFNNDKIYATAGNLTGGNGAQLPATTDIRYNVKVETNVSTEKNKLTVNDATDTVDFAGSCYADKNLLLFAKSATSISEYAAVKLYSYKLTIDNVLVRNFVPAKDSSGVVGMFDTVSQTFFTNAGTGDFVAGNTVSDPVEIYADGTVETLWMHGKNLFDISTSVLGGLSSADGSETSSTTRIRTDFIPFNSSATITISDADNFGIVNAYFYDANKDFITATPPSTSGSTKEYTVSNNSASFIRVTFCVFSVPATNVDLATFLQSEIQIEQGSTATDYVPYFDGGTAVAEMLLKVGDYQDVQEIISGVVTRNVGVKVLDGSEDISVRNLNKHIFLFREISNNGVNDGKIVCTHFGNGTSASLDAINDGEISAFSAAVNGRFTIRMDSANTVEQIRQFLADQYANGTPVIIVYPLATPTTESVARQTMQVQAGDNVVEITQASMSGLELSVKYLKGA